MIVAKVLAKGQVVIPKEIREKTHIVPGDKVEVKLTEEGIVILPLKKNQTEKYRGLVKGRLSMNDLEKLYEEKP